MAMSQIGGRRQKVDVTAAEVQGSKHKSNACDHISTDSLAEKTDKVAEVYI